MPIETERSEPASPEASAPAPPPKKIRTGIALEAVMESFFTDAPDVLALQAELKQMARTATLLPETVKKHKDGSIRGSLNIPSNDLRGEFTIAKGASFYRIEFRPVEYLEEAFSERQLALQFVDLDGGAAGVVVFVKFRPSEGEGFRKFLEERKRDDICLNWQVAFNPEGIKATQVGAMKRNPESGAPAVARNTGRNVQLEWKGRSDLAAFDPWLRLLRPLLE